MERAILSRDFPEVGIFILGTIKELGVATIVYTGFTFAIQIRSNNATGESPFDDMFSLTPFTNPYQYKNGYHIFDLKYYQEFTTMSKPPRICFHDNTQDPGITLNFVSKEQYLEFFSELNQVINIKEQDLPGYFKIISYSKPQYISCPINKTHLQGTQKALFNGLQNQLFQNKLEDGNLDAAMQSMSSLKEYVLSHKISLDSKAAVWFKLSAIGDFPIVKSRIMNDYKNVKEQWINTYSSQTSRCANMIQSAATLSNNIIRYKQKLMTIIPHPSILIAAFNVVMSLCMENMQYHSHHQEILEIVRIFLAIFIENVEESDGEVVFVHGESRMTMETLEAAVFWSTLIVLEIGGVSPIILHQHEDELKENILKVLSCIKAEIPPLIFSRGEPSMGSTSRSMSVLFADSFAFCDCADFWIAALASGQVFDFTCCFAAVAFLVSFLSSHTEIPVDFGKLIEHSIQTYDHWTLISATKSVFDICN